MYTVLQIFYHFQTKDVQLYSFPFRTGPFNFHYSFMLDWKLFLLLHLFFLLLAYLTFHTLPIPIVIRTKNALNSIEKPWIPLVWILHFWHNMSLVLLHPRSKNSAMLLNTDLFCGNEVFSTSKISNCQAVVLKDRIEEIHLI